MDNQTKELFQEAISLIKFWYEFAGNKDWEFYNTQSPEMKRLNSPVTHLPANESEALFYLSELVRTVSRLSNNWPHALTDDDLDRLTQSMAVLKKYPTDKSKIPHQSAPPESDVEKSVVSAEQVLDNIDETYYDEGIATVSYDTAVKAMQEYASQFTTKSPAKGYSIEDMAAKFAEWVSWNDWEYDKTHDYWFSVESVTSEYFTTKEVYTKFINSLKRI